MFYQPSSLVVHVTEFLKPKAYSDYLERMTHTTMRSKVKSFFKKYLILGPFAGGLKIIKRRAVVLLEGLLILGAIPNLTKHESVGNFFFT